MTAPSCPISSTQIPYYRTLFRGSTGQPDGPVIPNIPMATDVPSLIKTVNIMRDVLRQLTTSKTVNNLYLPRPPNYKRTADKYYSQYPNWEQVQIDATVGFVFFKDKKGPDPLMRAKVERQLKVTFMNRTQQDKEFKWSYTKKLDAGA